MCYPIASKSQIFAPRPAFIGVLVSQGKHRKCSLGIYSLYYLFVFQDNLRRPPALEEETRAKCHNLASAALASQLSESARRRSALAKIRASLLPLFERHSLHFLVATVWPCAWPHPANPSRILTNSPHFVQAQQMGGSQYPALDQETLYSVNPSPIRHI